MGRPKVMAELGDRVAMTLDERLRVAGLVSSAVLVAATNTDFSQLGLIVRPQTAGKTDGRRAFRARAHCLMPVASTSIF